MQRFSNKLLYTAIYGALNDWFKKKEMCIFTFLVFEHVLDSYNYQYIKKHA